MWIAIIHLAYSIIIFVLALVGKIINLIPLVNLIYGCCSYLVYISVILIGLIANLYSPKEYFAYVNEAYRSGLEQAISYGNY